MLERGCWPLLSIWVLAETCDMFAHAWDIFWRWWCSNTSSTLLAGWQWWTPKMNRYVSYYPTGTRVGFYWFVKWAVMPRASRRSSWSCNILCDWLHNAKIIGNQPVLPAPNCQYLTKSSTWQLVTSTVRSLALLTKRVWLTENQTNTYGNTHLGYFKWVLTFFEKLGHIFLACTESLEGAGVPSNIWWDLCTGYDWLTENLKWCIWEHQFGKL